MADQNAKSYFFFTQYSGFSEIAKSESDVRFSKFKMTDPISRLKIRKILGCL